MRRYFSNDIVKSCFCKEFGSLACDWINEIEKLRQSLTVLFLEIAIFTHDYITENLTCFSNFIIKFCNIFIFYEFFYLM